MARITRDELGLEGELLRAWQENHTRLLVLLARMTSWDEAADLLQETFVRVYQARPSKFHERLAAKYLVRVAATTATDFLRERYAMDAATADYLTLRRSQASTTWQSSAEYRVLLREIDDAAQHLSSEDQALLATFAECGNITAEARRMGIPTTTLASRYYAAIRRLRRELMR